MPRFQSVHKFFFFPGWSLPGNSYQPLWDGAHILPLGIDRIMSNLKQFRKHPEELAGCLDLPEPETPIGLCAHSLGSMLAIAAAAFCPRVKLLILLSPFARFTAAPGYHGQPREKIEAMLRQLDINPERLLRNFYRAMWFPERPGATMPVQPLTLLRTGLEFLRDADYRFLLPRIRVPVLIIHGKQDKIVAVPTVQALADGLNDPNLLIIEQAGHALPFTHTEKCRDTITEFLREVR